MNLEATSGSTLGRFRGAIRWCAKTLLRQAGYSELSIQREASLDCPLLNRASQRGRLRRLVRLFDRREQSIQQSREPVKNVQRELAVIIAGRVHTNCHIARFTICVSNDLCGKQSSFAKHHDSALTDSHRETLRFPLGTCGT